MNEYSVKIWHKELIGIPYYFITMMASVRVINNNQFYYVLLFLFVIGSYNYAYYQLHKRYIFQEQNRNKIIFYTGVLGYQIFVIFLLLFIPSWL